MMFKKYPSIISETDKERFDKFVNKYPELKQSKFVATEKIHGANIQLYCDRNGVKIYSRTQEITDYNFCGSREIIERIKVEDWFLNLTKLVSESNKNTTTQFDWSFRIYGELFGTGIQKGVEYGERNILWFDLEINDGLITYVNLSQYIPKEELVPYIELLEFKDIQDYLFNQNSKILEFDGKNIAEGAVIRPLDKEFFINTSRFTIKRRNAEFFEKVVSRSDKEFGNDYLTEYFKGYITEQRALNLLSKGIHPKNIEEVRLLLPQFIADAKKEFFIDFREELSELDKDELKSVFNVGSLPLEVMKKVCCDLGLVVFK